MYVSHGDSMSIMSSYILSTILMRSSSLISASDAFRSSAERKKASAALRPFTCDAILIGFGVRKTVFGILLSEILDVVVVVVVKSREESPTCECQNTIAVVVVVLQYDTIGLV